MASHYEEAVIACSGVAAEQVLNGDSRGDYIHDPALDIHAEAMVDGFATRHIKLGRFASA